MKSPQPQRPIRLFIAGRYEVMRIGVRVILEEEVDLKVVGEADNVHELFSRVQQSKPNVIVLDAWLLERWNADGFRKLCTALPSIRIILLMEENDTRTFCHVDEGRVQGYLSKSTCRQELRRAIRMVAKGTAHLGQESADQAFRVLRHQQGVRSARAGVVKGLSPQEQRVIALLAEGNTNKEIAAKLTLSDKTVKNYLANMFTKLAVERRTQAVALYYQAQKESVYPTMP